MNIRPKISVQHALDAAQAVRDSLDPTYCAYIVLPNVILTLSNARFYADGVFYNPDAKVRAEWQQELKNLFDVLGNDFNLMASVDEDLNPTNEAYVNFDLLNPAGLAASIDSYSFFTDTEKSQLIRSSSDLTIRELLRSILSRKQMFRGLDDEYVSHVCSGLILGYPEKAILGNLELWQKGNDEFAERLISADIRGADYYICPQPVYDYPRHLATDPDINTHEKLWSGILKDFYRSALHRELAEDKSFQAKMKSLTKY